MSEHRRATRAEAAVLACWADVAVLTPVAVPADAVPLEAAPTGPGRVHVGVLPAAAVQTWLHRALPDAEPPAAPWPGLLARGWFDLDDGGRPVRGSFVLTPLLDLAHALFAKSAGVAVHPDLVDAALDQVAALAESLAAVLERLAPAGDVLALTAALARAAPRVTHRLPDATTTTPVDLLGPPAATPDPQLVAADLRAAAEHGVPPALAHLLAGRPGSRPVRRSDVTTVEGLAGLLSPDDVPRAAAPGPVPGLDAQVAVTALLRDRAPLSTLAGTGNGRVVDDLVAGLALDRAEALVAGTPVDALTDDGVVPAVAGRELLVVGDRPGTPELGAVLDGLRAGTGLDLAPVTPGEWGRRRHALALAAQAVTEALAARADATGARWEVTDLLVDVDVASAVVARAEQTVTDAQQQALAAELALAEADETRTAARAVVDDPGEEPPRRAVARRRRWLAGRAVAAQTLADAEDARTAAEQAHTAARAHLTEKVAARSAARDAVVAGEAAVAAARRRTRPEDVAVVDDAWWTREDDARRGGTAWVDDELHGLRQELALAAEQVRDVAVRVLTSRLRARLLGDVERGPGFVHALGLVHPVLRVAPADLPRLLTELPPDALGWLVLPEGHRTACPPAAAALRHVRHGVVAGDPDAPPTAPVVPPSLLAHLATRHGLPGVWGGVDVLTLAASTATVGADVDGRWQGLPVRDEQGLPVPDEQGLPVKG